MNYLFLKRMSLFFSLSNAISSLKNDTFNYEHSWEDNTYSYNNSKGEKMSISFFDKLFLLCIQDFSKKNIIKEISLPHYIEELGSKETFLYLLDETSLPYISNITWNNQSDICSNNVKEMKQFFTENFNIVEFKENEIENFCIEYFELSKEELELIYKGLSLLENNTLNPKLDIRSLEYDEDCIDSALESFNELGIDILY